MSHLSVWKLFDCMMLSMNDVKRESHLDATQWFMELMSRSTCFRHYYAHHQELETIQMITACGT